MPLRYPLSSMFHGDVDCYMFNAELIPNPLLKDNILFTLLEPSSEEKHGQPIELKNGERLYSVFDPEFMEQFEKREYPIRFGVALGPSRLVAVVVHGIEHFWTVAASLGQTCSTRNIEQDTITMFFWITDGSLSNMDFVKALDSQQDDEFKKLVAEKGRDALTSPLVKPVLNLITSGYMIEMNLGYLSSQEPIKEISAAWLCEKLSDLAFPWPLVEAHYIDGADKMKVYERTHYYWTRSAIHTELGGL